MPPDSRPQPELKNSARFRFAIRLGALILAVLIAYTGPHIWVVCGRILPGLSPFLAICSAIACRGINFGFLLAIPLLIIALFQGRWFCRWLCPTGTLAWLAGRIHPWRKTPKLPRMHVGRWLAAFAIGGALAGVPWFLYLDPLAMWNGFFSACWPGRITMAGVWFGLGLALIALSGFLIPHLWCERLCPLGACQHGLGEVGLWIRQRLQAIFGRRCDEKTSSSGHGLRRRGFLAACVGVGALFAFGRQSRSSVALVRPPGAAPGNRFLALCTRCGACFRACPHGIIVPDMGGNGFESLMTPCLSFEERYCSEWCRECTRVCPTGAIRELALEAKRRTALGLAVVNRSTCLAWSQNQYCMVCDEYCPYDAIQTTQVNGINCPVVDENVCAGCGACESQCPVRPEKAIRIQGHAVQQAASPGNQSEE